MKRHFYALLFCALSTLIACSTNKTDELESISNAYPQSAYDALAIGDPQHMSAASKRALERGYHLNADWFGWFSEHRITGDLDYEAGVIRRDPSRVLMIDGRYYTWYTKSTGETDGFNTGDPKKKVFPWDRSDIWYATSEDGWHWEEQGLAVARGAAGAYDDRSVFTPEILEHNGKFYLVYQAVKSPYSNRVKNTVGMAISNSPHGPWTKTETPILRAADNGVWEGDEDNHFKAKVQGDFDSHKVHDPTLMFYKNKFYLYYKGERMGERRTAGGREIRWGVAIAEHPEGPYIKSKYNPITQSGHEILIWPYRGGMAMISTADGPERLTMQYAEDGINFEIKSYLTQTPHALGLVDALDTESHPTAALEWGLFHIYHDEPGKRWWQQANYIGRFSFHPNKTLRPIK